MTTSTSLLPDKDVPWRHLGLAGGLILLVVAIWLTVSASGSATNGYRIAGAILMPVAGGLVALGWLAQTFQVRMASLETNLCTLEAAIGTQDAGEDPLDDATLDGAARKVSPSLWPSRFDAVEQRMRGLGRRARALHMDRSQSRDLAEKENGKRLRFLSSISHELRTPLHAILGYCSLLLDQADSEGLSQKSLPDLKRIHEAGHNLLGLVDNLFRLHGMQDTSSSSREDPILLDDLLEGVVAEAQGANQQGTTIAIESDTLHGEMILGDPQRLRRCLRNLVDHAALMAQGGRVTLAILASSTTSGKVHIAIRDNGPRPDARMLQNMLKTASDGEFSTPDAAASGMRSGLVSLAMAHGLARTAGGELQLSLRQEGGLERILALPAQTSSSRTDTMTQPDSNPSNVTELRPARSPHEPGQKVALIIDDDPAAIDLLARWTRRCGYQVLSATDGHSGYEIARRENPDLVLLDALMPGSSGYDVLPLMRSDPVLSATPIMLVTVDDDRERGLHAGASDFVRKPISEAELRRIISVYDSDAAGDILVIEDDDDAATIMCRNLSRLGFTPRRAADGAEGLEQLRAARPAAIVLDLNMPRLNGFEFIEALGRDYSGVPVVVVSGQDLSLTQHRQLMAAGCRFFLKGASAPREIAQTLREVVA